MHSDWDTRTCCPVWVRFRNTVRHVAEASTAPAFTEELQEELLLLGDIIALRAMGVSSRYPHLMPERSKKRREFGPLLHLANWGIWRTSRVR